MSSSNSVRNIFTSLQHHHHHHCHRRRALAFFIQCRACFVSVQQKIIKIYHLSPSLGLPKSFIYFAHLHYLLHHRRRCAVAVVFIVVNGRRHCITWQLLKHVRRRRPGRTQWLMMIRTIKVFHVLCRGSSVRKYSKWLLWVIIIEPTTAGWASRRERRAYLIHFCSTQIYVRIVRLLALLRNITMLMMTMMMITRMSEQ